MLGVPGLIVGSVTVAWALIHSAYRCGSPTWDRCTDRRQGIGHLLFRDFLLPFEVTSVLILIAIMGAVVLARREKLMVPLSYYLVLSAILFALRRARAF